MYVFVIRVFFQSLDEFSAVAQRLLMSPSADMLGDSSPVFSKYFYSINEAILFFVRPEVVWGFLQDFKQVKVLVMGIAN